jgi:glycosyltransferase domain-containing protein
MLRRTLQYLAAVDFPWRVFVADSSNSTNREENLATVTRVAGKLDVGWLTVDAPFPGKCVRMLNRAASPYAVICGDDDFLMPDTLHSGISFLNGHPDFSCVMGITVTMRTHRAGRCYALPGRSILDDSPVVRFRRLASNWFSTFSGVYRTCDLRELISTVDSHTDYLRARIFPELLFSHLTVLRGRVEFFPSVQNLCQDHELNMNRHPGVTDNSARAELYDRFQSCLAGHLEAAGATLDHANQMVDGWYDYLRLDGDSSVKPSVTVSQKVRRETVRHYRRLVSLVSNDSILQRRGLHMADLRGCEDTWKLAHRLICEYPDGMPIEAIGGSGELIPAAA